MFVETGDKFNFFLPAYVVFGRGTRSTIPEYTGKLGISKVLLVVDPFFTEMDYFSELVAGLEGAGIEVTSWSGVVPDQPRLAATAGGRWCASFSMACSARRR